MLELAEQARRMGRGRLVHVSRAAALSRLLHMNSPGVGWATSGLPARSPDLQFGHVLACPPALHVDAVIWAMSGLPTLSPTISWTTYGLPAPHIGFFESLPEGTSGAFSPS